MTHIADEKKDLRRGIDHIGVSASFVVHDGKGRVLLQKRGAGARDENGRWDVGGGAIEFGESIDETVRREIKEELYHQGAIYASMSGSGSSVFGLFAADTTLPEIDWGTNAFCFKGTLSE